MGVDPQRGTLIMSSVDLRLPVHGVDLVCLDREDHTNLFTAAAPLLRATGVPVGEVIDVLPHLRW
jgi:hypothetical protein